MAAAIRLNEQHSCSLDHLVGAEHQAGRNFMADRFCKLQIDDQLELGWLFDQGDRPALRRAGLMRHTGTLTRISCQQSGNKAPFG